MPPATAVPSFVKPVVPARVAPALGFQAAAAGFGAAALEATSTSSASLRAVEVSRAFEESEASDMPASSELEPLAKASGDESAVLTPALVAPTAPRAPKRGWLVLGAGAALALAAGFLLPARGPGGESRAPANPATNELEAAPVAAAPAAIASAIPAPAPTAVENVAPAVRSAQVAAPAVPASPVAVAYDEKALEGALRWGITQSEACHRGGRPVGTARAIATFGPAGKVVRLELEGEPIASAPVSKCIVSILRSMMIPAFQGPEFTITREITLR